MSGQEPRLQSHQASQRRALTTFNLTLTTQVSLDNFLTRQVILDFLLIAQLDKDWSLTADVSFSAAGPGSKVTSPTYKTDLASPSVDDERSTVPTISAKCNHCTLQGQKLKDTSPSISTRQTHWSSRPTRDSSRWSSRLDFQDPTFPPNFNFSGGRARGAQD